MGAIDFETVSQIGGTKKTIRIWAHMCLPLFLIYTKIGSMDLFVSLSLVSS